MTDLPEPLTPPECDLRDFGFMPIEVARLRHSKAWLHARRDPELGFYMMNLWMASWHEKPAASLEDDDDVLADLAMCEPRRWPKVREKVLRGWVKCSDGRLYHPVVAEKVAEAWERKKAQRQRTEAAREARRQKPKPTVTEIVTHSVTENATDNVTNTVTASKGQGQGEKKEAAQPLGKVEVPRDLDVLEAALRAAAGLTEESAPGLFDLSPIIGLLDRGAVLDRDILPVLRAKSKAGKLGRSWKFYVPAIEEAMQGAKAHSNGASPSTKRQRLPGTPEDWPVRIQHPPEAVEKLWLSGAWFLEAWGPRPGEQFCEVPQRFVDEWESRRKAKGKAA
jgi:hypothetical protein